MLEDKASIKIFYKLIVTYPQSVHLGDFQLNTLLHHAVRKMNILAVMVLLEFGSSPWKENEKSENTLSVYISQMYSLKDENRQLLFDILKIINLFDESFIHDNQMIYQVAVTRWNDLPFAGFVLNHLPAVFDLGAEVKVEKEIKKLIKVKK